MGDVTVRLKEVKIKKFGTWEAINEVFIVSLALDLNKQAQHIEPADELGKLLPQSFLAFNKYAIVSVSPLFHKVRRGDKLPLLGDGLILYGPRDPMGKVCLHAAIMESDTDNRDIAKKMKKALVKAKVFETVEAAGTIASIAQTKIAVVARPLSIARIPHPHLSQGQGAAHR